MIVIIKVSEAEKTLIANSSFQSFLGEMLDMVAALNNAVPDLGAGVAVEVNAGEMPDPAITGLTADAEWLLGEMDKVRAMAQPSMDCPECGGTGQISGGSLGNMCVGCDGSGVVDAPFSEPLALPNIADFKRRLKIVAPGDTLAIAAMRKELDAHKKVATEQAQLLMPKTPAKRRLRGEGRVSQKTLSANVDFDEAETSVPLGDTEEIDSGEEV